MNVPRTVLVVFLSRVGSSAVGFLGLVAFVRELGPATFGVFVLFQGLVALFSIVVDFGINDAVEKRLSEGTTANVLSTALLAKVGLTLLVGACVYPFLGVINGYLGGDIARFIVPALFVQQAARVCSNGLRGELRVQEAVLLEVLNRVVYVGVGLTLAFLGYGVISLVVGYFAGWGIQGLAAFRRLSWSPGRPTREAASVLFGFSKYNFVSSVLSGSAYNWIDTLVIGLFLTQTAVTAYEAAWLLADTVMILSRAIGNTIFPQVSDWDANGARLSIESVIPDALTGSVLLVIPATVGAVLLGEEVLGLVFGSELVVAAAALSVLMAGKLGEAVNAVVGRVLLGVDRPDLTARSAVVFMATNVALNFLLVEPFGLVGAAVATSLAFFVNVGLNTVFLSRFMRIRVPAREVSYCLGAAALMGVVVWVLERAIGVSSLPELLFLVALGAAVYFAPLGWSSLMRAHLAETVDEITG